MKFSWKHYRDFILAFHHRFGPTKSLMASVVTAILGLSLAFNVWLRIGGANSVSLFGLLAFAIPYAILLHFRALEIFLTTYDDEQPDPYW